MWLRALALLLAFPALPACTDQAAISPRKVTVYLTENIPGGKAGYAVWYDTGACIVWAPPPKGSADYRAWAILYHEFLHCELGSWH